MGITENYARPREKIPDDVSAVPFGKTEAPKQIKEAVYARSCRCRPESRSASRTNIQCFAKESS